MKRLFLLIPVLVFSLLANAKEIEIGSSTSNIIHYTIAASSTSDGDVIVLTDAGPYVNSKANSDDYTKISKNVTIKAASGIHPVIKFEVPIQARDGKSGKFIGIKFDGSSLQYDHFIYFKDGNDNELEFEDCEFYNSSKFIVNVPSSTKAKSLVFRNCKFYDNTTNRGILNQGNIGHLGVYGCEFSGFVKDVIDGYTGTSHVDSCIVKNSYFHNHSRGSIFFEASTVDGTQTCDKLIVKNSTFANINGSGDYHSVIDIRPYSSTNTIKVEVDHCTFYNNTVINSDHANIRTANISDVTVSNCIFAYPSAYATRATYCTGGGNINNCLTYNYTADGTKGHAYGCTVNAASSVGNPLFTNAASGDFTFANNWVTMSLSPACGAATDGSDLGDPRWYTDPVVASTDFASPGYYFDGEHASLGGKVRLDANNYIEYYNNKPSGTATWKIHATKACALQATLNMYSAANDHNFSIEVTDAEGAAVGSVAEAGRNANVGDLELSGRIILPSAGDYTVRLINDMDWSEVVIKGITLMSVGKAFTDIPGTLDPYDANTSSRAYAAAGGLYFAENPGSHNIITEWGSWKVRAAETGTFLFTMNVTSTDRQSYKITIFDDEDNVIDVYESANMELGDKTLTHYAYLAAGDYTVKVQPTYPWSHGHMVSLVVSTPADLTTLDQAAENNSVISANNGLEKKLQLTRTITGGMYNTICLPFSVVPEKAKEVFGSDVQLMVMSSATIDGEYLYLVFSDATSSGISAGTPYLIKTSRNIVNPVFAPATISAVVAGATGGTAADYIGTLIKAEIPANENNLFLGADNKLQFSTEAVTIKGFRGYFNITAAGAPRRARLVTEEEQVVTELELVNGQLPETFGNQAQKFINNGQLIIVKDGAHYNALGVRVK